PVSAEDGAGSNGYAVGGCGRGGAPAGGHRNASYRRCQTTALILGGGRREAGGGKRDMPKSMSNVRARQELLDRLERLSPDATPLWGKMNASQMLAHLTDWMLMASGD